MVGYKTMGGGCRTKGEEAREGTVVLVALDAAKEITGYALEWAIRNVVQPKDTLILLALLKSKFHSGKLQVQAKTAASSNSSNSNQSSLNQFVTSLLKKWGLRNDSIKESSCEIHSSSRKTNSRNGMDEEEMRRLIEVCLEMMNDLCSENNVKQVRAQVKLLPCAQINSVVEKAKEYQASWVIVDRRLKKESEYCSRQLSCNIILVDHAIPKIIQLVDEAATEEKFYSNSVRNQNNVCSQRSNNSLMSSSSNLATSSLGFSSDQDGGSGGGAAAMPERDARELPSLRPNLQHYININPEDMQRDKSLQHYININPEGPLPLPGQQPRDNISILDNHQMSAKASNRKDGINESDTGGRRSVDSATKHNIQREPTMQSTLTFKDRGTGTKISGDGAKQESVTESRWSIDAAAVDHRTAMQPRRSLKGSSIGVASRSVTQQPTSTRPPKFERAPAQKQFERESSIRQTMSLSIKQPRKPPPLCSICKHKTPVFGKPPRKFSYQEMEEATDGFSMDNFLAEGGYGPVYKGVLEDGQVVAVKKHKKASAQGAAEFCSEVEVLSCAQHRNLVMLVGYCVEGEEWMLVYEFACNGSLDKHLQQKDDKEVMAWHQRQKVAIGAARGLRYLHEDCRVGCIIHRDLRPNNILLTHDFEPMVGDFGLARWQTDGQTAEETRIVGTLGYLAPEYTQTGQITEKTDVYAFGLLLIELISGLKVIDLIKREKLHHIQWGTSLIQRMTMHELVDPQLNGNYVEWEVKYMMHVASLCVSPDPEMRPRMSQVLRMLEEDMPSDNAPHRQSQRPNPITRSNVLHQHSQTPTPVSRSNSSPHSSQSPAPVTRSNHTTAHQRSQTPIPISTSSDGASHLHSWTPPPTLSRYSYIASQLRSQTPPPTSRSSDGTYEPGSQIPIPSSRPLPAHSPSYSMGLSSPFEQSKFVQQRYGLRNEQQNNNTMTKPAQILQTNTTAPAEMEKLNSEKILNQEDHFTTQKYQAYLRDSYFDFIQKTKGVSSS